MPKIIYRTPGGAVREVEAPVGANLMESAVKNTVPGIDGDCGGAAACATCHVYVDEAWIEKLPPQSAMEREMLDFAEAVQANSRLGCQIKLTDALDGISVTIPASQH